MCDTQSIPDDSALAPPYVHERELAELSIALRQKLGLVVYELRDSGGRVVTYGYYWQRPEACGRRVRGLIIGYPTLLSAIIAGLLAGGAAGLIDGAAARVVVGMDEGWECCENETREPRDEI